MTKDLEVFHPKPLVGQQPAALQPTEVDPMIILKIAAERGAGPDELERITALVKYFDARKAEKEFHAAYAGYQGEGVTINATGRNKQYTEVTKNGTEQPSRYPTLDDMLRDTHEPLAKHGLSVRFGDSVVSWNNDRQREELTVSCILAHAGGHHTSSSSTVPVEAGEGAKSSKTTGMQLVGIAETYAQKYAMKKILALQKCGPDTDGNLPEQNETIGPDELDVIEKLIEEVKLTDSEKARVLKWLGVDSFNKILMSDYRRTIKEIEKRKEPVNNG